MEFSPILGTLPQASPWGVHKATEGMQAQGHIKAFSLKEPVQCARLWLVAPFEPMSAACAAASSEQTGLRDGEAAAPMPELAARRFLAALAASSMPVAIFWAWAQAAASHGDGWQENWTR